MEGGTGPDTYRDVILEIGERLGHSPDEVDTMYCLGDLRTPEQAHFVLSVLYASYREKRQIAHRKEALLRFANEALTIMGHVPNAKNREKFLQIYQNSPEGLITLIGRRMGFSEEEIETLCNRYGTKTPEQASAVLLALVSQARVTWGDFFLNAAQIMVEFLPTIAQIPK